jgi:putative acetyltransferase
MLEIVRALTETQVQHCQDLSAELITLLIDTEKAMGVYDPAVYETYGYETGAAQLPGEYIAPDGCLLLALLDGQAAGCIAMHKMSADVCAMRMMYVRPAFRGHGIGRALVTALMDEAIKMGCSLMKLETITYLTDAQRLYRSLGFYGIEPYYKVEHSLASLCLFMERALTHEGDTQ